MTPEEKSLLERTYRLSVENNNILHSMRRSARLTNILRIIYWVVIIAVSVGAYYVIQPYLTAMLGYLHTILGTFDTATSTGQSLNELLKTLPVK